jgi:hypothetical protein
VQSPRIRRRKFLIVRGLCRGQDFSRNITTSSRKSAKAQSWDSFGQFCLDLLCGFAPLRELIARNCDIDNAPAMPIVASPLAKNVGTTESRAKKPQSDNDSERTDTKRLKLITRIQWTIGIDLANGTFSGSIFSPWNCCAPFDCNLPDCSKSLSLRRTAERFRGN